MGLYRRNKTFWMSFIDNSGKQHQKSTGTSDRKLAEKIYHKVQAMVIEDKWFEFDASKKHNFDELMDRFLAEHAPTVSQSMQKSYRNIRDHLNPFFAGLTLDKLDSDLISQYVVHRRSEGCRPATRNRELAMLSKMFNLARLWKWTRENPCSLVKKEKEDNEIGQCLTDEQEDLLLDKCRPYCNGDLPDMVLVALNTGIREGEVLKLHWSKIDLVNRTFQSFNEKTDSWRTVPMNETVYEVLSRRNKVRSISGYVFVSSTGNPYESRNMYREFKKACKAAGIPSFRFHDARHTAATRLARAGKDIYSIAAFLDHSQLSTSKRYAKHSAESLRDVAAVLDKNYREKAASAG